MGNPVQGQPGDSELADSTKRLWGPWLDKIRDHFGALSIRQFDRPQLPADIRRWRDQWRATPRTADYAEQVLSRVLSYAVAEGALEGNGIPNLYAGDRSDLIWEEADLEKLCHHASPEVGYAARLAVLTGLRRDDLFRLSWPHVGEHAIEIKTAKGRGRRIAIAPHTGRQGAPCRFRGAARRS